MQHSQATIPPPPPPLPYKIFHWGFSRLKDPTHKQFEEGVHSSTLFMHTPDVPGHSALWTERGSTSNGEARGLYVFYSWQIDNQCLEYIIIIIYNACKYTYFLYPLLTYPTWHKCDNSTLLYSCQSPIQINTLFCIIFVQLSMARVCNVQSHAPTYTG